MYKNFNLTDQERQQIMEMHASHGYKKPMNESSKTNAFVNEQESNPFRVGQTVKAIRDKDNKVYTIQIAKIGGAYIGGKITGPGKYQDQPLDGTVTYELTSNQSGQLSGNMDMGVFKITQ